MEFDGSCGRLYAKRFQPAPRLRKLEIELKMAEFAVKARNAQGNIVAETSVERVARRR